MVCNFACKTLSQTPQDTTRDALCSLTTKKRNHTVLSLSLDSSALSPRIGFYSQKGILLSLLLSLVRLALLSIGVAAARRRHVSQIPGRLHTQAIHLRRPAGLRSHLARHKRRRRSAAPRHHKPNLRVTPLFITTAARRPLAAASSTASSTAATPAPASNTSVTSGPHMMARIPIRQLDPRRSIRLDLRPILCAVRMYVAPRADSSRAFVRLADLPSLRIRAGPHLAVGS